MAARASAITALMLAGCATVATDHPVTARDEAALDKALAGLTPQQPLECLPYGSQHYSSAAYGPVLVYTVTRGLAYVNRTTAGCEGVADGDVLTSVQYREQTCSGDIVRTLHPVTHLPIGSCTLGAFVPYRKLGAR